MITPMTSLWGKSIDDPVKNGMEILMPYHVDE
jgi:hypothetical protein